eukprot:scaffold6433_cov67-Phaeocystis_antarctica.AAC.6
MFFIGKGHAIFACRTRVNDRHARMAGCGGLGRQSRHIICLDHTHKNDGLLRGPTSPAFHVMVVVAED